MANDAQHIEATETGDAGEAGPKSAEGPSVLAVEAMPGKRSYSAGEAVDYSGAAFSYKGEDVTGKVTFSPPAGETWKKGWKEVEVTAVYGGTGAAPASCTFTLRRKRRMHVLVPIAALAHAADGGYTVTIPKKISYENMPAGRVSTSDTFDVSYAGTTLVEVSGTAGAMTGGNGTVTATVASAAAPIMFGATGAQSDTVSLSGETKEAATWSGTVQYAVAEASRIGTAYAIFDDATGTLTFLRSRDNVSNGTQGTVTDIMGNSYAGTVYTGFEDAAYADASSVPWSSKQDSINSVKTAPWQVIAPVSTAWWFSEGHSLADISGLAAWDTSSVTDMSNMFQSCTSLADLSPLAAWDTSSVTDMSAMFSYCFSLENVSGLANWNTSKVTDMSYMLSNCMFITDISDLASWNTAAVNNMSYMFDTCTPLADVSALANWNTTSVTDMSGMFLGCGLTDLSPLASWDTASVTNMSCMFTGNYSLADISGLANWNTARVTDMSNMFSNCPELANTSGLATWNTASVRDMTEMFSGDVALADVSGLAARDTSTVTNMSSMFYSCTSLAEIDISNWDKSSLTDISNMFYSCYSLTTIYAASDSATNPAHNWTVKGTTSTPMGSSEVFYDCPELKGGIAFNWSCTSSDYAKIDGGYFKAKASPTDGTAYAVLDADGKLTLFRSFETYGAGADQTVTDIMGNTYTGQVYTDIETTNAGSEPMWIGESWSIESVDVADGQVIAPVSTAWWFGDCSCLKTCDLEGLDTSNVTDMSSMFYYCNDDSFTAPDVSRWDTSKVTSMYGMFGDCSGASFTAPDVSNWNTSKVTNMSLMFSYCSGDSFTAPDVSNWDTSNVTDMSGMFESCSGDSFTAPDVSNWDTSKVTSMVNTFAACSGDSFTAPDVSRWDTSSATNMHGMFGGCSGAGFTAPEVANWDTSSATDVAYMFNECSGDSFTAPDVSKWDTSKVTNMAYMFNECSGASFTAPDVSNWNTSNVTDMSGMFEGCSGAAFTAPDVSKWDTSKVTSIGGMFEGCSGDSFTAPNVSKWDTSKVTSMSHMFSNCSGAAFTETDLSGWDVSKVSSMTGMFYNCANLKTIYADPSADWSTSAPLTRSESMFSDCYNLKGGNGTGYTSSKIDKSYARVDGLGGSPGYFTAKVNPTDGTAYAVFDDATGTLTFLRSNDTLSNGTQGTVTDIMGNSYAGTVYAGFEDAVYTDDSSVPWNAKRCYIKSVKTTPDQVIAPVATAWWFYNCPSLDNVSGLAAWDTSSVTDMSSMFQYCSSLDSVSGLGGWNTSKATDMSSMFDGCFALADISPLANWNTASVTNMSNMFYFCYSLADISGLASWDTSSVTDMSNMFNNCFALANLSSIANWNTAAVTNMSSMFYGCSSLTDVSTLSAWNTASVTDMSNMFYCCYSLAEANLSNWDKSALTDMSNMFYFCYSLTTIYAASDSATNPAHNWTVQGMTTAMESADVFNSCYNLKGSITFDSSCTSSDYAKIDGGYFTDVANHGQGQGDTSFICDPSVTPTAGIAYAVFVENTGELIFFRSTSSMDNNTASTITDIMGNSYAGTVYTGFEDAVYTDDSSVPWNAKRCYIKSVKTATGQVIAPVATAHWFNSCYTLADISGLANWNTSKVTNMSNMFSGCYSLTDISPLAAWNTAAVTEMSCSFNACCSLTDVSSLAAWDTSSVTDMSTMFAYCYSLADISGLANWNISSATDFTDMFTDCYSLADISGLANWNTSSVTSMLATFSNCFSLADITPLANWDTSSVRNTLYMFADCYSLTEADLSNWDKSSLTEMQGMFYNCFSLATIYAASDSATNPAHNWTVKGTTTDAMGSTDVFYSCCNLKGSIAFDLSCTSSDYAKIDGGYFTDVAKKAQQPAASGLTAGTVAPVSG